MLLVLYGRFSRGRAFFAKSMPVPGNEHYKSRTAARRWQQSGTALDATTVERCVREIGPRWKPNAGPIMITYATEVAKVWLLGLSAASCACFFWVGIQCLFLARHLYTSEV